MPFYFPTSIKSNIKFGKEDASMDEVIAAKRSCMKNVMGFNKQYDTILGKRNNIIRGQNRGFP
jgi:ATP-binding cassette subfamily B protein